MKQFIFVSFIFLLSLSGLANSKTTRYGYINTYKEIAVREMLRSGIPASITLAQGCLESDNGNSPLAKKSNNHFGIKCKSDWKGERSFHDDDEKNECFRKYNNPLESYIDHTEYLVNTPRYASLFKLSRTDYSAWAHGLRAAGYATDPNYAIRLIKIIEDEKLYIFDSLESYTITDEEILARYSENSKKQNQKERSTGNFSNISINPYAQRETFKINGLDIIYVKEGDTYESIAEEFGMKEWEIHAYNNLKKDAAQPAAGSHLFLERKKCKAAKGTENHTVQPKETMSDISQKYGVSLRSLYCKNRLKKGTEPAPGTKIYLRKMKPKARK